MILIADLGATNARFCVTEDGKTYFCESIYKINDFDSLEELCSKYISDNNLDKLDKGIIGVAAPILGDKVVFVNADLEFRISELKSKIFSGGLLVVNDLELQAYAVLNLQHSDLTYIGKETCSEGPKILVAPGTGLGLAGLVGNQVVSTEAGHINISDKILRPDLKKIIDRFILDNKRVPTYEDLLSGKGITYFYTTLSGDLDSDLTSEKILSERSDPHCLQHYKLIKLSFSFIS